MTVPEYAPGDPSREKRSLNPLRVSISSLPRRVNHGGAAWLGRRSDELRQPQDGAPSYAVVSAKSSPTQDEIEDVRITGGTRSLVRRLMGLNVASFSGIRPVAPPALRKILPRQTLTA